MPTLRFYGWEPACLSLGRLQKTIPPHSDEVVRRPTGGRAVWHQHEITYSVAFPLEALPEGATSVIASYRWISSGFIEGLRALGVGAALAKGGERCGVDKVGGRSEAGLDCFAASAACDFVVDGRKLIGAAQCRKKSGEHTAILQHGSLLLEIDAVAWQTAIGTPPVDAVTLRELGVTANRAEIVEALCQGIEAVLGIELLAGELTANERALAGSLRSDKYASVVWTVEAREPTLSRS